MRLKSKMIFIELSLGLTDLNFSQNATPKTTTLSNNYVTNNYISFTGSPLASMNINIIKVKTFLKMITKLLLESFFMVLTKDHQTMNMKI